MSRSFTRVAGYVACAAIMVLLLAVLQPSAAAFGWYFCATFWMLVGFDFYRSQVQEPAIASAFPFEDRFIGYLFTAPFVWPVRLLELKRGR